jgi:hypothetical protein
VSLVSSTFYVATLTNSNTLYSYCTLYVGIVMLGIAILNAASFFYLAGSMKASRTINALLVNSVFSSTLRLALFDISYLVL